MTPLRIGKPRHVLVVAPHPDDEAIGAFGLIRLLRVRGAKVRVVIVADGAASHPSSMRWPKARLIAERRRETRRAMRLAGVPAGDLRFLDLPDGGLPDAVPRMMRRIDRVGRQMLRLDLLIAPATDDHHPDHRAVARQLRVGHARRLSYLIWPRRDGSSNKRLDRGLKIAGSVKRTAILAYRTQCGGITDDPDGFALSRSEIAAFSRPIEGYREERV